MTIKLGRRGLKLVLGAGAALVLATTTVLFGPGQQPKQPTRAAESSQ